MESFNRLYVVLFLHQTTTGQAGLEPAFSCMLFYSYIKPQLSVQKSPRQKSCMLFYSYIKPQQSDELLHGWLGCMLFYSYIKPQPRSNHLCRNKVVCCSIPTSNHNVCMKSPLSGMLYVVLFLHQTTTMTPVETLLSRCMLFYSYIKPQLIDSINYSYFVVCCSIPTSNHNTIANNMYPAGLYVVLFLHQTTTAWK